MNFPDNLLDLINKQKRELSSDDEGQINPIKIVMINGDTQEIDTNLLQWTVTETSSTKINISLTFEKPLFVSQGDEADILLI